MFIQLRTARAEIPNPAVNKMLDRAQGQANTNTIKENRCSLAFPLAEIFTSNNT